MAEGPNEKERPVGHESQGATSSRISRSNWTSLPRRAGEAREAGREETESSSAMNGHRKPSQHESIDGGSM